MLRETGLILIAGFDGQEKLLHFVKNARDLTQSYKKSHHTHRKKSKSNVTTRKRQQEHSITHQFRIELGQSVGENLWARYKLVSCLITFTLYMEDVDGKKR